MENLIVEIMARKRLNLSDPYATFVLLGELGARIFQYYTGLEHQWLLRYELPSQVEPKVVNWQDYETQITSQFYNQPWEKLTCWKEVLQNLLTQLHKFDFLTQVMAENMQRLSIFPNSKISGSHYMFYHDKAVNRLSRYIEEVSAQRRPLLNLNGQVQIDLPSP